MSNKSQFLRILPILMLLAFVLTGCKDGEGKEAFSFVIGFVVFLSGTIITGLPAIILSAISINNKNASVPIIAIVLTALYTIFLFMEISIYSDVPGGMQGSVALFPLMTFAIIVMCIVFIIMGYKNRKNGHISNADNEVNVLDDIINSKEDNDLL